MSQLDERDLREAVRRLESRLPTYRGATVTAVDTTALTYAAEVDGVGEVDGIEADEADLPGIGERLLLPIHGATPVHPARSRSTTDPTLGQQSSSWTKEGIFSARRLESIEDPVFQGRPLSELLAGTESRVVGFGRVAVPSVTGIGLGEQPVMEILWRSEPGRAYALSLTGLNVAGSVAGDDVAITIRNGGAASPSLASPVAYGPVYDQIIAAGRFHDYSFYGFLAGVPPTATATDNRLLLTVARGAGGSGTIDLVSTASAGTQPTLMVLDIGPNVENTGQLRTGGVTPAVKQTYDQTFNATWSQTYLADNTQYHRWDPEAGQGAPGSGLGSYKSLIGFPDLTATLAGATVTKVEISLYTNYVENSTGTAVVGKHALTAAPATFSGTTNQFTVSGWGRNQRKTIDVTSIWASQIQAGTIRGITLGPEITNIAAYYMWFNGAGMFEPPKIRVVYTR